MGSNCCKQVEVMKGKTHQIRPIISDQTLGSSNPESSIERILDQSQNGRLISWRLGNPIGEGMHGKVFQAMDDETGELLAVKVIKLPKDPSLTEKLFRETTKEIELLKYLRHKNVITYYQTDIDIENKCINIIFEYITGGSLHDVIMKYGTFSDNLIRNYTNQILKGLVYIHSKQIVHRDLKSPNILVTEDAVIKLSDFGCSKRLLTEELSVSLKGSPY